ncbi:MAG TPA: GrpB family protein [Bryobacteraceae bacterium]|nr:GrpB family protein [Bryobacteraceae bacterium]
MTPERKIAIAEYDPRWPELFRREADRIQAALEDRALLVEHTGSTAVPGLAAKPVIDITLAVADSGEEAAYAPALTGAGYVLRIREPAWHQHRMFKGPDTEVNLHVFSEGCPEIRRILRFRDWLRSHPSDRDLYARTKRSLAQQPWKSVDEYAIAKTAVIEEILARARNPLYS